MQKSKLQLKVKNLNLSKIIKFFSRSGGFTFIELLVVIAVLSILIALTVFLINPKKQFEKARDANRKSDLRQIQAALEMYRSDQGGYPLPAPNPGAVPNCPASGKVSLMDPNCGTIQSSAATYLQKVAVDPNSAANYIYYGATNKYCIRACLENTQDSERDELAGKYGADNPTISGCTLPNCSPGKKSYTLQNP